MRGSTHSQHLQESKQNTELRRYPVSARAYKKKDYDYLSTFPRMAAHSVALRASTQHDGVELSHERSDGESDLFTSASSNNEYATSVSSASSTSSSIKSYLKDGVSLTDMESNHQHQISHSHNDRPHRHHHHHHHHHLQSSQTSTRLSPENTMESTDLQEVNDEELGRELKAELKDNKSDLSGSAENDSVEVKEAPVKLRAKVRSRHVDTPAVLPKFGSWDTKNPSSGEAYTLIFRRLRDEKKSGGVPVCGSPTHPKAEQADEPETKAKEPLCPKPRTQKGRKAKTTSHHDAAHSRTRWILCCKTSVVDD